MNAPTQDWDVVIAGAGLAGLSLAAELAAPQFSHLRVLLVEPRKEHVRDRTWSYWALPQALPSRWQGLAKTLWPRWCVSLGDSSVISKGDVPYASVRADAFYDKALGLIAQAPHIHWLRQTSLEQVQSTGQGVELILQNSQRLNSKLLFDSRPPASQHASDWVQHFTGWEVKTSKPCFESQCLDLMAFEPRSHGLHFVYCLPYSSTQALVESTWISRASVQVDADAELRGVLEKRYNCTDHTITFREQGALPLMPSIPAAQPHVIRIGRAGGMLRAATGYAFCASLHQTAALAGSLAKHLSHGNSLLEWRSPSFQTHVMDRWMDDVLFRVLERDWLSAPKYFMSLFERVPERQLIRFLQGEATWQDRLTVMRALPPWPFMKAAIG